MNTSNHFLPPHILDERLSAEKEYWIGKLSGASVVAGVPVDYSWEGATEPRSALIGFQIDDSTRSKIIQVTGGNPWLTFTVLVTALKLCLRRYASVDDITIGTVIHRQHADVALLNRCLAIRDHVRDHHKISDVLVAVKRSLSDAFANQKYPLERIMEILSAARSGDARKLFSVAMVLDNIGDPENLRGIGTNVNVILAASDQTISGRVEYDSSLFAASTVELFIDHFRHVLSTMLRDPQLTVGDISLLSVEKQEQLVVAVNRTSKLYPQDRTIWDIFDEQARKQPDAIALECAGMHLSFGELRKRADHLARYLLYEGVQCGEAIGLYLENSIEAVVGILGILKCGGTYVPLDPAFPRSRTAFVVRDARIKLALTQARLAPELSDFPVRRLCLDAEWHLVTASNNYDDSSQQVSASLAYIIYTSGSTGDPKGVGISHKSLLNYLCCARDTYLRAPSSSFPLYSSLAFDLTVTSIFTPLLTGGRLIIYSGRGADHPLHDVLSENSIDVLKLTPSHLSMIRTWGLRADRVGCVIVGGEAFHTQLARTAETLFASDVDIFNEYGPTEATVGCLVHKFNRDLDRRETVPIGLPMANVGIYILDERGRPVPENTIGELGIAGNGLAAGYWRHAASTAERFVPAQFLSGQRLYRTGDLACWLPEGKIEYRGRSDEQVKFNGYRLELNEIRVALNRHPAVSDSYVAMRKGANANQVLVAYYAAPETISTVELRDHMRTRLIEAILPNYYIHVREFPLTPNGKVDHRALPSFDNVQRNRRSGVIPATQTEELLEGIWSQALGIEDVGADDDFFELGGHSLVAHQIVARVRAALRIDFPLRLLFEATTVRKMATAVDEFIRKRSGIPVQILPRDQRTPPPLSFAQERLWFLDQLDFSDSTYNISQAYEIRGALDPSALEEAFNRLLSRHESLRTHCETIEGRPHQVIATSIHLRILVVDLRNVRSQDQQLEVNKVTEQTIRRFSLSAGPLLRVSLLRLGDDRYILVVCMHHIVSDAVSMSILYRELAEAYVAVRSGKQLRDIPLPIQYADYAAWQRKWLRGELLEEQLSYWRSTLQGFPAVLDLLPSRQRPTEPSFRGTYRDFVVPKVISHGIKNLCRQQRCTIFMALFGAFNVVVRYFTHCDDILAGVDIANRDRTEIEHLIGFFVNTLPLRVSLKGSSRFSDVLALVRDICLAAFSHKDVPFELLVKEMNPDRQMDRNPLFQLMFGFVPQASSLRMKLPGLEVRPVQLGNDSSPFDFSLYMTEGREGFVGTVRYKTDLYDSATILLFIDLFQMLLTKIVTNLEVSLQDLDEAFSDYSKQSRDRIVQQLRERREEMFSQTAKLRSV